MALTRQSRPDSGFVFQAKHLETSELSPFRPAADIRNFLRNLEEYSFRLLAHGKARAVVIEAMMVATKATQVAKWVRKDAKTIERSSSHTSADS